jgi:hypothetical protein
MPISIRQTQKGDWLVFEAIPAKLGIGVQQVGTLAGGYNTGFQYNRFPIESDAEDYAILLAEKLNSEIVEWEYPQQTNVQFEDLPKLYPTQSKFDNANAAQNAGWIRINPNKTITHYKGVKIYCSDITPGAAFGYDLAITANSEYYLESSEIWIGNYFSIRFRAGDIVDVIKAIKQVIDNDLCTQAEAVRLGAPSIQAVNNAIRYGKLRSFDNPDAKYQRQGKTLVSKSEVAKLWGKNDTP